MENEQQNNMQEHYVCPNCGGSSQSVGVCQTEGCENAGHDLVKCDCADGMHTDVKIV